MLILQLRALIVDCFREALDRKLFWVMAGISVLIAAAMACVGMDETGIHFLFGKWNFETDVFAPGNPRGPALIGTILTYYIGDFYIGWIGIIIALVATAGIFPTLMERGAIDVVLAKPISRPMIFLGKYLGSMVFVALQATIFILLTFLVVGLRWHCWLWAYLGCTPPHRPALQLRLRILRTLWRPDPKRHGSPPACHAVLDRDRRPSTGARNPRFAPGRHAQCQSG